MLSDQLEAVLGDHVNQITSDFSMTMHGPYLEHLATAEDLLKKKPGPYHALMHDIFKTVT